MTGWLVTRSNVEKNEFNASPTQHGKLITSLNHDKQKFRKYSMYLYVFQAFGGLVVAMTVKYADNILKGFATSISIIVSSVFSYLVLNDLIPGGYFILGTGLVILATFMYGSSSLFTSRRNAKN